VPILIGSVVLLLAGLVLKATLKKTAQPMQKEFSEGIGQYRLQLGRGDAD
jgi:hypothetical protein